jgi:hypothetical protein
MKISTSARNFMQQKGIKDVTFNLIVLSIVKEIEPVYEAPSDARGFRYFQVEGCHIFISREIKILGPLTLDTEGFWKIKRLCLNGATVPI